MDGLIRWNLSGKGRLMRQADGFFVSFPKSGRTWIRVFYYAYLSFLEKRDFSWNPDDFPQHPRLFFTHDQWEHRMIPGLFAYVRGKHLIPPTLRRTRKIALLVRDPRDVVVSLFFDLEKRKPTRSTTYGWQSMPLADMIRHPKFGLPQIVGLMNRWLAEWHQAPNFKLFKYEECRSNETIHLRDLLAFYGLGDPDPTALAEALAFSKFDAMRRREAAGVTTAKELQHGNQSDPDSFKSRRGKVGGFVDYFSPADLQYASDMVRRLDPRFGYQP